ncbi:MAG: hypothetical protein U5L07_18610 [Desulfobacterales bacterium]|nr:hypothetical protein [Desulfobacterales bacterium]
MTTPKMGRGRERMTSITVLINVLGMRERADKFFIDRKPIA